MYYKIVRDIENHYQKDKNKKEFLLENKVDEKCNFSQYFLSNTLEPKNYAIEFEVEVEVLDFNYQRETREEPADLSYELKIANIEITNIIDNECNKIDLKFEDLELLSRELKSYFDFE